MSTTLKYLLSLVVVTSIAFFPAAVQNQTSSGSSFNPFSSDQQNNQLQWYCEDHAPPAVVEKTIRCSGDWEGGRCQGETEVIPGEPNPPGRACVFVGLFSGYANAP